MSLTQAMKRAARKEAPLSRRASTVKKKADPDPGLSS
jgi:hypothetical protein